MPTSLLLFLVVVAFGAYVQTVTGFAFGIIVLTAVTLLDLASIPLTATALNIMNLALALVVVVPGLHQTDWRIVRQSLLGGVPALVAGLFVLSYLSDHAYQVLKLLLGLLIVLGGVVLAWRPDPIRQRSRPAAFVGAGLLSGFFSGLFTAGGPPVVYQFYRQPLPAQTIRMTLLVFFTFGSVGRLGMVAAQGGLTVEVMKMGGISIPVVAAVSWLAKRFPPPISERTLRRWAFSLLMLAGGLVIFTALVRT